MGIIICWEEFTPAVARHYADLGAEYFVTMVNNAEFDSSGLKKYVSFFMRARAAENLRYVARIGQTGLTQIINPFGKVIGSILPDKEGYLAGELYHIRKRTFYSKHGDILTKVFLILMSLVGFTSEVLRRKNRAS